jgi:type VI secretion system protein ImpM
LSDLVLNPSPIPGETGFYGKIPARGDFIARRLEPEFLRPLDDWLQQSISTSRRQLQERWLPAYLEAPIWRFVIGSGLCGDAAAAGILMPSVDRVGRYFPLVLAAGLPGCAAPIRLFETAESWFAQLEQMALSSLEDEFDFDRFDSAVRAAGVPVYETSTAGRAEQQAGFRIGLAEDANMAQAYGVILDQVLVGFNNRFSLWWSSGSERVPGSLLIAPGLPAPQNFAAFMDGDWDKWGWERPSTPIPLNLNLPVLFLRTPVALPCHGKTHPGTIRPVNEDALLMRPDLGLWAVADGVGGHKAGDFASRTVVEALDEVLLPLSAGSFAEDVQDVLKEANSRLRHKAMLIDDEAIVASTVAVLMIYGDSFTCAWAGDSRIYLYRQGVLRRLTIDHVDRGAGAGGGSGRITKAVGAATKLELEFMHDVLRPDDRFLLCSDGLTGVLSDADIAEALAAGFGQPIVDRLIDDVLVSGAPDNVTAVLVAAAPEASHGA